MSKGLPGGFGAWSGRRGRLNLDRIQSLERLTNPVRVMQNPAPGDDIHQTNVVVCVLVAKNQRKVLGEVAVGSLFCRRHIEGRTGRKTGKLGKVKDYDGMLGS